MSSRTGGCLLLSKQERNMQIACWTCSRTTNCKQLPDSISKIKSHVCNRYEQISDEERVTRDTLLDKVGYKIIKTMREVPRKGVLKMTATNPVVSSIIDAVTNGQVDALKSVLEGQNQPAFLMLAACKLDSPENVTSAMRDIKAAQEKVNVLKTILLKLATDNHNPSATAAVEVEQETPKTRKPRTPKQQEPVSPEDSSDIATYFNGVSQKLTEVLLELKQVSEGNKKNNQLLAVIAETLGIPLN